MASSDTVTITIHGKGGHGAMPKGTVDAVVVGASIVMALQTIVARNLGAQEPGVITVGSFQSGMASNVIADSAVLKLSVPHTVPGSILTMITPIPCWSTNRR
ncbi:N-acyl-L-amino acid amidohydrolase [compost metagenome]